MALDTLEIFGDEFTNVAGIKAFDDNNQVKTYIRPQGTKTISAGGTGIDVTEYASVDVATGTEGTPTATKGTVLAHRVSVTPSVTNTTGYITGSTKTGTAVQVTASELVSGNKSITENGTDIDVTNYATVSVDISPELTPITVTSVEAPYIHTPDMGSVVASWSASNISFGNSTVNVTISPSLNFTDSTSYIVYGTFSVFGYSGSTTPMDSGIISGEWSGSSSLKTIMTHSGDNQFNTISLSPSTFSVRGIYANTRYLDISIVIATPAAGTYDGFSQITVNPAESGGNIEGVINITPSSSTATSLEISLGSGIGSNPIKAFVLRLTSQLTRSSSYSYYYITTVIYDGNSTYGNYWRMSNGTFYNDTTHYSYSYNISTRTLTISSSAGRGSAGGSFYSGTYELTYVY